MMHPLMPMTSMPSMSYYEKPPVSYGKSYYDLPMPPAAAAAASRPSYATAPYCQPSSMAMPSAPVHAPVPAGADNKYRQLPCRTFISVGTCPYRERCIYLHDPRIICRDAKTKTRRKNKEDNYNDSLFWPIMPMHTGMKLDSNRQPAVIQQYNVPAPAPLTTNAASSGHDEVVYSMWMHFVDFCIACSDGDKACYLAPDGSGNMYTGKTRLPVFRALSAATASNSRSQEWDSDSESSFPIIPSSASVHAKDAKSYCRSPDTVAVSGSPPTEYRYLL